MKNALVVGATGFIGSCLATRLGDSERTVYGISRSSHAPSFLHNYFSHDISDISGFESLLERIFQEACPMEVYFLAGQSDVGRSVLEPLQGLNDTVLPFITLLHVANKHDCTVILGSSGSVIGGGVREPGEKQHLLRPKSPYAAAKISCEAYAVAFNECYSTDVRIARIYSVYGAGLNRMVVYDVIRRIMENPNEVSIRGSGEQVRDYLYVEDVADALITIAEHGRPGEVYDISSGNPISILKLTRLIAEVMGYPDIRIVPDGNSVAGDVDIIAGEMGDMDELGFKPLINLKEGLHRTVSWVLSLSGTKVSK